MRDRFGRRINYLRVSVTDRCNLRCRYCMPEEGVPLDPHDRVLSYEELERVVRAGVSLGIDRVRITGGEPLVRRGLVGFVRRLSRIPGLDDLSLTTNGTLLGANARALREAGLSRVNVSLDTLDEDRFRWLTRGGELAPVLEGIERALEEGLTPVKINVVVVRGFNDDEVVRLASLALEKPVSVRFIELMPIGAAGGSVSRSLAERELVEILSPLDPVRCDSVNGGGPAEVYRPAGGRAPGTIGLISPLTKPFCERCNRLRLTARGALNPCLAGQEEVELRSALRSGAGDAELRDLFLEAVRLKPAAHSMGSCAAPGRSMSRIGG